MTPVVAIVGRPNVGKSTLFNRLCGRRDAIVDDRPGATRDRHYGHAEVAGHTLIVVDTGGIEEEYGADELRRQVRVQVEQVLEESDAVLFVVDAIAGLTPPDEDLGRYLRRLALPLLVIANKAESPSVAADTTGFHRLGLGEPLALSARHGVGVDDLHESLGALLERSIATNTDTADTATTATDTSLPIRVALVGRPNTGKSTLVNALAGENRVIVMDEPGTTRDSIRVPLQRDGRTYELIDTAGVRRRARVHDVMEKVSVIKTLQALAAAEVALLLLDARAGVVEQDLHLAGLIEDSGRAVVVAINKWDGLDTHTRNAVKSELERKLRFLPRHQALFISALHGSNLAQVPRAIDRAHAGAVCELTSGRLNRVLQKALVERSPPGGARPARLKYCHQGGRNPPRVIIHGSRTRSIPESYRRFLANRFQQGFDLTGVRVKVLFKDVG